MNGIPNIFPILGGICAVVIGLLVLALFGAKRSEKIK